MPTLGTYQSRREAELALRRMAGELSATYSTQDDSYTYIRDAQLRRISVEKSEVRKGWWEVSSQTINGFPDKGSENV